MKGQRETPGMANSAVSQLTDQSSVSKCQISISSRAGVRVLSVCNRRWLSVVLKTLKLLFQCETRKTEVTELQARHES